jgi:hypothetical protein
MKAAETSASSAIADWTPLAVVSRSRTTAEIDTFIRDVSTTRTNIAIARRTASRESPLDSSGVLTAASALTSSAFRSVSARARCASSHGGSMPFSLGSSVSFRLAVGSLNRVGGTMSVRFRRPA